MKRATAHAVYSLGIAWACTALGAVARPGDDSLTRAFLTGAAIVTAGTSFAWAARELGKTDHVLVIAEAAKAAS